MGNASQQSVPVATSSLPAWLDYLERLHPTDIDMGLERVAQVADRANIKRPAPLVISVSGTNGKGSTVRYIETILQQAGYKTGVYTSPHMRHYRERVRINHEELSDVEHTHAFSMIEQSRSNTSLTYFEYGTLAALWLLKQAELDVAILEVGLGGRLDAVNCVDADVAVITSIGIDHIAFLGNDREVIGREKAGIARSGHPLICGDRQPTNSVAQCAEQIGARLWQVGRDFHYQELADRWHYRSQHIQLNDLPYPQLPLINAPTAIAAIEQLPLPVSAHAIREGIASARLPGRMQTARYDECALLLDVAHNPQAAAYARRYLSRCYSEHRIFAVVGMLTDKDHAGVIQALTPCVAHWYLGSLSEPRGESATSLIASTELKGGDALAFDSVEAALTAAIGAAQKWQADGGKSLVFGFGSFYTVARINAHIQGA